MEETTPLVHDITSEETRGPQSPMDALRAQRDEFASRRDTLIPLTGYEETGLRAKYRLLERRETDAIANKVRHQTRGGKDRSEFMFNVLIDTIIAACEGFYLQPNGSEEPEQLKLMDGQPVESYLQMAGEMRGDQFTSHRQAVLYVFGDNEFAAGQHGLLLNRWLSDTTVDIDEEMLEG